MLLPRALTADFKLLFVATCIFKRAMYILDSKLIQTFCQTAAKCRIPQETEQIM